MKLLLTTIAAVLLVGCGQSDHHSHDHDHTEGDHHHAEGDSDGHDKDSDGKTVKELKTAEPVAEAVKPEPPTAKTPDI
jgi:major membrane immunogen (membrane-anchored lipoprotein)